MYIISVATSLKAISSGNLSQVLINILLLSSFPISIKFLISSDTSFYTLSLAIRYFFPSSSLIFQTNSRDCNSIISIEFLRRHLTKTKVKPLKISSSIFRV